MLAAMIAAMAIVNRLPVLTRDNQDFASLGVRRRRSSIRETVVAA